MGFPEPAPTSTQLNVVQGGTLVAPAPTVLWTIQPVDSTKAPFQAALGGGAFSGVWDYVFRVGYNASDSLIQATEPVMEWVTEVSYQVGGKRQAEMYWQWIDTQGKNSRPLAFGPIPVDGSGGLPQINMLGGLVIGGNGANNPTFVRLLGEVGNGNPNYFDADPGLAATTISALTNVGTTCTATVASNQSIFVGQTIVVAGVAGFTTNNPNGTWTVASTIGTTQFTFVVTLAPTGAYTPNSGTVAVTAKATSINLTTASGTSGVIKITDGTGAAFQITTTAGTFQLVSALSGLNGMYLGKSVVFGGNIANNATDGFVYLPRTNSGTPTGVPTAQDPFGTGANATPLVSDANNGFLFAYQAAAWQKYVPDTSTSTRLFPGSLHVQGGMICDNDLIVGNGIGVSAVRAGGGQDLFVAYNLGTGNVNFCGGTGSTQLAVLAGGQLKTSAANETTGGGTALLGTNCPAVTVSAPYKWEKITTADGSQGYFPVWK